jgi:hypothetical protein
MDVLPVSAANISPIGAGVWPHAGVQSNAQSKKNAAHPGQALFLRIADKLVGRMLFLAYKIVLIDCHSNALFLC